MKKIMSILCAVALLTAPINVYAQEIFGDGSAETTVTAHVDSQYCVLIPETIVADGTLYNFTATSMLLAPGDSVNIAISGLGEGERLSMSGGDGTALVRFTSDNPNDSNIYGSIPFTSFSNGQTTATYGIRAYLDNAETLQPGDYTGTVTFNIFLTHNE